MGIQRWLGIFSKYSELILLAANYLNVPETNRFTIKGSFGFKELFSYAFQSFPFLKKKRRFTTNEQFTELY
jgi:hypothetical protein